MKEFLMFKGANKIINVCGQVKPEETVLVIADHETVRIGEIITTAAHIAGAESILTVMSKRRSDGSEPPLPLKNAVESADLFVAPVSISITHTEFVEQAIKSGSRGLMLTQFTEDMLREGGIEADFESLAPTVEKFAKKMENAKTLKIKSDLGTKFECDIRGRRGNALTCIVDSGEFSPVPNIEANISPVEGTSKGKIVVDGSIPYSDIGVLVDPVVCQVEAGNIEKISGGVQADKLKTALENMDDPKVYNIAEVGIGLNPHCRLTGLMLEDEGVYGSIHIGIGTNITLGGNVKAACHYDLVIMNTTLELDGEVVLDKGDVVI